LESKPLNAKFFLSLRDANYVSESSFFAGDICCLVALGFMKSEDKTGNLLLFSVGFAF